MSIKAFLIALQFLTRFPLWRNRHADEEMSAQDLGRSMLYYPLVGLLIGLLLAGAALLLSDLTLQAHGRQIIAAILLALWVGITGALHLDGLADSADAWLGGYGDRERTLAIMKDPYCGPAGAVTLMLLLLLKFVALAALLDTVWWALVWAPLLGRSAVLLLFLTAPYVRPNGLGSIPAANLPRAAAWSVLALVGVALLIVTVYFQLVLPLLCIVLVFFFLRYLMQQRLGGLTGDTAGAMIEVVEMSWLVALALVL